MFLRVLRTTILILIVALLWESQSSQSIAETEKSLKLQSIQIHIPPQTHVEAPQNVKVSSENKETTRLYFSEGTVFPLQIKITDLFGAHLNEVINDPSLWQNKIMSDAIITNKQANPLFLANVPRLCPRAQIVNDASGMRLVYQGNLDVLNDKPHVQIFDPDVNEHALQREILQKIDGKNNLMLRRVRISYDNEDSTIVDYQGLNPITQKPELIYEGEGGFYANFHYAIIPFDERVKNLDRQELLNLAEGKLKYIHREDLTPQIRTHSFLPGPYLSKDGIYQMCEWGDTMFQAPVQEMTYDNIILWDWDLFPTQKLMLIVWEGDEEDWLIADGLLDPYYLTDDIVGIFVLDRSKTLKPTVFKNEARNFEIEVMTQ